MKTNIFCAAIACLFISSLFAQKNKDALYLKNGNIYRGTIITPIDTSRIGIELKDRSVLYFSKSEIEATNQNVSIVKPSGFNMKITTSIFGGGTLSSGIKIQGGYRIKNRLYLGIGSGLEGFGNRYIPIFGEINYNFTKGNTQPFIYGYGGYNMFAGTGNRIYYNDFYYYPTEYKGGPMAAAGFGVTKHISSGFSVGFQCGYRFQYTSYSYTNYFWTENWEQIENGKTTVTDYMNRLELGINMIF